MAITVEVEMALLTISETRKDVEEEEQLANSCYITTKSSKFAEADTYYFINPIIWVGADSITLVTMQRSAKYSLHEKVDRFNMSVGHKRVTKLTNPTDQVEKMHLRQQAVQGVGKQVGITMTILAYCWDRSKQIQNLFYVVRDQGVFKKAT